MTKVVRSAGYLTIKSMEAVCLVRQTAKGTSKEMPIMSTSNRSEERKNTVYNSKLVHAQSGDLVGYVIDLSDSGIRLMSPEPQEVGSELELRLELPEQINGQDSIELTAAVRWCETDIPPDYQAIGLEVLNATDEVVLVLATVQGMLSFAH